jgi:hypothetical protein
MDGAAVHLRDVVTGAQRALAALPDLLADPGLNVTDVIDLVGGFDALLRVATAGWVLAAHRAEQLEAHEVSGHRNATDWLAQTSGSSFAIAKGVLDLSDALDHSTVARQAFETGGLSLSQALVIGDAVSVSPSCGDDLLEVARQGSHRELCQQAARVKQAARHRDEERQRRARAFHRRSLRFSQLDEGGVRVQILLTEEAWGRCLPSLQERADELFRRGRSAAVHGRRDQYLADALVDLLSGAVAQEKGGRSVRTGVTCIVRINAETLKRGSLEQGEVCEIAGVGPVSVETVRDLLGESAMRLLVMDGADVATMTSATRDAPARVEAALFERDLVCVVPGCDVSIGLQTHHWRKEFHLKGPTELDNLCRVCAIHHGLVTNGGWDLRGGPGRWEWVPPEWPVSASLRSRRRRIAAARGRSAPD